LGPVRANDRLCPRDRTTGACDGGNGSGWDSCCCRGTLANSTGSANLALPVSALPDSALAESALTDSALTDSALAASNLAESARAASIRTASWSNAFSNRNASDRTAANRNDCSDRVGRALAR
jgi:hypothetical protein